MLRNIVKNFIPSTSIYPDTDPHPYVHSEGDRLYDSSVEEEIILEEDGDENIDQDTDDEHVLGRLGYDPTTHTLYRFDQEHNICNYAPRSAGTIP